MRQVRGYNAVVGGGSASSSLRWRFGGRGIASVVVATTVLCAAASAPAAGATAPTVIRVLSSRADLVVGDEAVVEIELPDRARAWRPAVSVDGRDVSAQFGSRFGTRLRGLLTGLRPGPNLLTVRLPDRSGARIRLTDHANGGPVFSGPQIQPWTCQPTATDKQCDEPPQFTYLYKSTDPSKTDLQPYDPSSPPTDVAQTTTDAGVTVPFIIRRETGYQDRSRYRIEVLFQPGEPWSPGAPQKQFNHKLLLTHGGSCQTAYKPTDPPWGNGALTGTPGFTDISTVALGRGFVVASTALDNSGVDCNVALQAESILMAQEHIWDSYGDLRYTIGEGCSGGSLAEQWMANAYPGLYQGLIATCTFPDALSTGQQIIDYALIANYFGVPISGSPATTLAAAQTAPAAKGWTPNQVAAVTGDGEANLPVGSNWAFSANAYFGLADPEQLCPGISAAQVYEPNSNPGGVRCGILDWDYTLLGPRPENVWKAQERRAGHGFAGLAGDDIGIQYGLGALQSGQISPEQFVDLNAQIGGLNIDFRPQPQRMAADSPALANAYRTGLINEANNLDRVPIINLAGPNDPGIAHDSYRAFALRARLDREHGTHSNQIMWQGPAPVIGDPAQLNQGALVAIDRWVAAIQDDSSSRSLPAKVIANRPPDIHDECFDGNGNKVSDGICGPSVVPVYGTPRTVAGEPITTDQNSCHLRPLNRGDYSVSFTDAQWARLQAAFPTGVCNWSQPGVDQQPTIAWQTYQDPRGQAVIGGKPLGPPPVSAPFGPRSAVVGCVGRRGLVLHLRVLRGRRLRRAVVYVNGTRVRVIAGRRLRSPVRLRRLPTGRINIRIVGRTTRGGRIVNRRRYRICAARSNRPHRRRHAGPHRRR